MSSAGDNNNITDKKYRALVIGGTGGTGKALVRELLKGDRWSHVITVNRRNVPDEVLEGVPKEKLEQVVVNTENNGYESVKDSFKNVDAVFSCIGTTRKESSDQERYRKIDYDLPLQAAHYAKEFKTPYFAAISSMGANENAWSSYLKLKGEIERDLKAVAIPRLTILQPGFLMVDRNGTRPAEQIAQSIYSGISTILPLRWKGIRVETIAIAMRRDAEHKLDTYDAKLAPSHETFLNDHIFTMAE